MTSANRSSEPICFEDEDALDALGPRPGPAPFLIGELPSRVAWMILWLARAPSGP